MQAALTGARAAGRRGRRLLGAGEGRRRRQPGAGPGPAGPGHPRRQGRVAGAAGRRVHRCDPRGAGPPVRRRTGEGDHRGRRARAATARPPAEAEDPRLDAAEAALERGDLAAAEAAYQAILDAEPDHPEASLALRQVQLFRRADEAGPDALAAAEAAPDDVTAQTRAADFLLGTGNVQEAFDLLLGVVRRTAGRTATRPASTWSSCSPSSGTTTRGSAPPAGSSPSPCSDGVRRREPAGRYSTQVAGSPPCRKPVRNAPTSSKPDAGCSGRPRGGRRTRAGTARPRRCRRG